MADNFVLPTDAEFDAALEVDHTQPFIAPIFSIEEDEEDFDSQPPSKPKSSPPPPPPIPTPEPEDEA